MTLTEYQRVRRAGKREGKTIVIFIIITVVFVCFSCTSLLLLKPIRCINAIEDVEAICIWVQSKRLKKTA